ncbi:helix-turn-helix domain-containing protein [Streptomyces sp. NPDC094032]|uniref:PucR family transcriptional regulator n=1 Tax=Streptomyces sp. NPDC094032 TaxID=3155308 RepID=UPI0033185D5D
MTPAAPVVLGRVLTDLGSTLVELAAGTPDPSRPVRGVLIHDPLEEPARWPGAVVLGVGVAGAASVAALTRQAAALGAAAVVVRSPVAVDDTVTAASEDTGVPVLGLTPGASWAQAAALLRGLLAVDDFADEEPGDAAWGDPLSGDLFALANAIAALLDGPVTVEDRGGKVLAFSSRQDEGDPARITTVLDRQVPADKLRDLEARGAFHALYRNEGVLYVAGPHDKPRAAIAVRAGGEILGSIWVIIRDRLGPDGERALAEAANVAALHLLRRRAGEDVGHRLRADLVATVLEGGAAAPRAAARLGLTHQPSCVLALALLGDDIAAADLLATARRTAEALALHLSAIHPRTATAYLGDVTYAVLPGSSVETATRVADAFLSRAGSRVPAVIGIGRLAADPSDLPRSRADADRALRVLTAAGTPHRSAALKDVYLPSLLLDLADQVHIDAHPSDDPVNRLRAYDAEHHSALTETLAAWLDNFGDVIAASAAVHVHSNTFRYRLKRLVQVSGFDPTDPAARFEAMLHLRLTPPAPPGAAPSRPAPAARHQRKGPGETEAARP